MQVPPLNPVRVTKLIIVDDEIRVTSRNFHFLSIQDGGGRGGSVPVFRASDACDRCA